MTVFNPDMTVPIRIVTVLHAKHDCPGRFSRISVTVRGSLSEGHLTVLGTPGTFRCPVPLPCCSEKGTFPFHWRENQEIGEWEIAHIGSRRRPRSKRAGSNRSGAHSGTASQSRNRPQLLVRHDFSVCRTVPRLRGIPVSDRDDRPSVEPEVREGDSFLPNSFCGPSVKFAKTIGIAVSFIPLS